MKKTATFLVVVVALFSSAGFVFGQVCNGCTQTFDELGNASGPFSSIGLQTDPMSGVTTLAYFGPGESSTAGDLVLTEAGVPTDLIRFEAADSGAFAYFYSLTDDGADSLADTVADLSTLPGGFQSNLVALDETGAEAGPNGLFYTPGSGQPGYDLFNGGIASYDITSDPISSVPEVSTWLAPSMAAALLSAGFFRRRRSA